MTPKELVTKSARRVNIIAHDEELSESELIDGVDNLNSLLAEWSLNSLINPSGINYPVGVHDAHSGLDDPLEWAMVEVLAVRLAGVYGIAVPPDVARSAQNMVRSLENHHIAPLYDTAEPMLMNLSR